MNDLEKFFNANKENSIRKWQHYFDIYDRHFSKFRGGDVVVVEFGVLHGGSLRMWKDYFGAHSRICGVDIDPRCSAVAGDGIEIFIGDQEDREFLTGLRTALPKIDIIIDDGGHRMQQQINTFEVMFPAIQPDGVYVCEDLHTSYWAEWGGGFGKQDTMIEYSKKFIDYLNAWHIEEMEVSNFTKSVNSLHYYDSILVIEKARREKSVEVFSGKDIL